jgi:hypothetical protein
MNPVVEQASHRPQRVEAYGDGTVRSQAVANARALLAADDAYVREAMDSVRWERRGLLQRLVRP